MNPQKIFSFRKIAILLLIFFYCLNTGYAHEAGATMDPNGDVATFTGYAIVSCYDDGNGPTDHLVSSIKDNSAPEQNLFVNLQIIHKNKAISITDQISGDQEASPPISLQGGNGAYLLLVNKTGVGARSFVVSYHCIAANGAHTGTDIVVQQFE